MVPVVVVDLGPDATADRTAWVLEACTRAIRDGRCVAEPPEQDQSPGAVAIVRVRDTAGRIVRIEVGRRREERAHWSVREMEFSADDPQDERWRSVGLALATLVGEIEQAEALTQPDRPADTAAGESPPGGDVSAALPDEPEDAGSPPGADSPPDDDADAGELEPLPRPRTFVGVGALAGPGSAAQPLRWGGGVRGAWILDSGLQLSIAGDYSAEGVTSALELDWLRFAGGAGYRYFASDRWSFGLTLRAGVRGLGTVAEDASGPHSRREWSLSVAGSGDVWWHIARLGGVWLEFELGTIGRSTRLLDRDGAVRSEVPFGDATGLAGLWFSL